MDGVAERLFGGLVHGLAERRVGVDGRNQFVVGGFHFDGQSKFGDHFGGVGAEDVRTEDLAVRFAEEDLDETFALANGKGFAAGQEGEFSDFVFEAFFLRGTFGQTDAGHLRLAVGAAGEDANLAR